MTRLTARAVGFMVTRCAERAGIDVKRITRHSYGCTANPALWIKTYSGRRTTHGTPTG